MTKSIETWFDVRVEKALESGLNLGREALDSLRADLTEKGKNMAIELGEATDPQPRLVLGRLRDQVAVQSAALYASNGQLLATATSELSAPPPVQPAIELIARVRAGRTFSEIDASNDNELILRAYVPVMPSVFGAETRILQLTQAVPSGLAANAERVQEVYRDYQELSLGREGLTRIYAMTLTLTVLLALFTAIATAFFLARSLSAPLSILAEGTQAVASGDFTPRQAIYSRDELGVLTQSFNQMTRQLNEARRDTERHRIEVESARSYLESVLANLSAGVLVFDANFLLRTANQGAQTILDDSLDGLFGAPVDTWARQQAIGQAIHDALFLRTVARNGRCRSNSIVQVACHRFCTCAAPSLPEGQLRRFRCGIRRRDASGGSPAQRCMGVKWRGDWRTKIKNPLTPIQLSAERLQLKLAGKLQNGDADMFNRSTQTIINQVQAMKRMVNEFFRLCPPAGTGAQGARSQRADPRSPRSVRDVVGAHHSVAGQRPAGGVW